MPILLCDLDETLLDRSAAFRRWASAVARQHGLDVSFVEWLTTQDRGGDRPREDFLAAMKQRLDLVDDVQELLEQYTTHFPGMFRCEISVRDSLLRARAAGWNIAVVTNGSAMQADKVTAAELWPLVDAICISLVDGFSKPDRRLLDLAAERCGTTLDGAWMVGDNPETDIGAAHSAGIASAWITLGRVWPRLDYRPHIEVETFAEAVDAILRGTKGARDDG